MLNPTGVRMRISTIAAAVSVASAGIDSSRYLLSSEGSHLAPSANATFTQYLCNGALFVVPHPPHASSQAQLTFSLSSSRHARHALHHTRRRHRRASPLHDRHYRVHREHALPRRVPSLCGWAFAYRDVPSVGVRTSCGLQALRVVHELYWCDYASPPVNRRMPAGWWRHLLRKARVQQVRKTRVI
mgnify:FL=1